MPASLVPTRVFARLVWLLVYRPSSIDEQKRTLREAIVALRDGGCVLSLAELNRSIAAAAQLTPVPAESPWLSELAARMAAHSVGLLDFAAGATAADVLGVARVLASTPVVGDDGAAFDARALALQLTTVAVRLGRAGFVRRTTPIATSRVGLARTPSLGLDAITASTSGSHAVVASAGIGLPTPSRPVRAIGDGDALRDDESAMLEAAFSREGADMAPESLLTRLEQEGETVPDDELARLVDEVTRAAEERSRQGHWREAGELVRRLVALESRDVDPDRKRTYVIHLRRLFKSGVLRGLAQLMGRARDVRATLTPLFVRAGEAGAEVLIELMVASNVASERRAYRTAIAACPAAGEPLQQLLDDGRWFVVRNAAELLGEMGVSRAEPRLVATLKHPDARVRRAAAGALARLGTSRGLHALQHLLGDTNAAVRLQAIHGLVAGRSPRSAPALVQALDHEPDAELQLALLHALGAHPTEAAVERLIEAAQPGTLLHRKASPYRVAAVAALGEAGTSAAMAALRRLQRDKDGDVRAAVDRALTAGAAYSAR